MVFITAEDYKNAGIDVIKDSGNYFWVKMEDLQDGLGIKNISDSLMKEMQDILETKKLTKEQNKKYKKNKK